MIPLRDDVPSRTYPAVTVLLIALNALAFLAELVIGDGLPRFVQQAAVIPVLYTGRDASLGPLDVVATALSPDLGLRILLSMFLHGGWMHLIGNMLYLWVFGNNIEDVMGHTKYVVFYLTCGILAALSHALTDPSSSIPMVGASGAISGVLGAYVLLFPRARVLVIMPGLGATRVPAGIVLGMWFLMQLLSGGMSVGGTGGGVAFFAHIGGFIAGMALIGLFKRPDVRFFAPSRRGRWED